jgi:hypothetical protein
MTAESLIFFKYENRKPTPCMYMELSDSGYEIGGRLFKGQVSANPGLKFNLLFWFVYFYTSVY